jgi:phage FluMu gp28-like protein
VQGVSFTAQAKTDLAAGLRRLLEQRRIRLPNDKKLIMQVNSLRYQVSKAGTLLFGSAETQRVHDDYLWALALACYAWRASVIPSRPDAVFSG